MADDLMDASGGSVRDGKDLGQDAARGKLTSVSAINTEKARTRQGISDLYKSSLALLAPWPPVQATWNQYLTADMCPVIDKFLS
jgi:geranylgeranyl pyrophosphate synthase